MNIQNRLFRNQQPAIVQTRLYLPSNLRHVARWIAVFVVGIAFASPVSAQVTRSFTEPIAHSNVAASEPGVVDTILVSEGQRVSAGDVLAQLDHEALKQSLRISQLRAASVSELRSAESKLRIRKTRRETIEPMLQSGHANPVEVEEAILEQEVAESELVLAREKIAEYTLEVDRIAAQIQARTITAPIDGVISELHYRLGEYMSSSKPQFATVVQLDQLLVRFYLLESEAVGLELDQIVPLKIRVGESFRDVDGKIKFVSPVTDPDSGTARIDVVIDNADGRFRSGSPCHWVGAENSESAIATDEAFTSLGIGG
ncbi:MAG: efflux RND transporter periplasmic adaptor subunit [Pirellulaceae bacterium]|nr:efflux RND transporter periplasmic adaptor subunit [Pirellulaceae bacterium]